MTQEVSSIPFLVAFDVVEKAIDFNGFLEYLKKERNKDVTIINGLDFADQSRGTSKTSSRSSRLGTYDSSLSIVKGIKSKIDSELSKLDSKKKQMAQSEKSKLSSHRSKSKATHEPPKFNGRIDMLYIIINFPYLPEQLLAMKDNGVCINSFITIKPNHEIQQIQYVNQPKLSSKNSMKKTIIGSEYDFTINPNVYPPARVVSLQSTAPNDVSFIEINPGENFDQTFKIIEDYILKILDLNKEFDSFIQQHNFIQLPSFNPSVDMSIIKDYFLFHPNDIINSLYFQLKEGNWKRLDPPPPESKEQYYDNIFLQMSEQNDRKVVFIEPKEPPDPIFNSENQTFSIHEYIYPLLNWEVDEENALAIPEVINFVSSINRLYSYAGSKFDSLITSTNKKYSLGLPLSFFDWEHWNLAADYNNISETLADAINNHSLVETLFDKDAGFLWVLVLNPIPKTMGNTISNYSMPFCLKNINEYMNYVSDFNKNKEDEIPNKKSRNAPTAAQIIKEKLDFKLILPSIENRIQNSKNFYRLPLKVCSSESFSAPYCFENGLYVQIIRDLDFNSPSFCYKFYYKDTIEAHSTSDSITFQPFEGIRLYYEFNQILTVFFNDQSLCFDGENLNIMSANEKNIIITKTGSLIFTNSHGNIIIVHPNGSISRYTNNKWITVDKDGISLDGVNRPHSSYKDDQTQSVHMIRSDNIEYTVYQGGKRLIVVDLDCTVEQNDTEKIVTFVIPNFPIIQWNHDKITFDIDCFNFVINTTSDEKLKFTSVATTENYTIKTNENSISFTTSDCDSVLMADSCQFKNELKSESNNNQFLIADSKGNEKVCILATEEQKGKKKKVELYESKWGSLVAIKETIPDQTHLNLYRLFQPRFFGIRKNMTGVEFLRKDTIKMDGYEQQSMFFRHPNGESINILSLHSMELIPSLFIQYEGLSKTQRSNVMKDLRIPKPKKSTTSSSLKKNAPSKQTIISNSQKVYSKYLENCSLFSKALEEQLAILQTYYIQDHQPEEIFEELPMIIPISTPNPRILNMMYNLHRQNVTKDKAVNYWESTESDFGFPIDVNSCSCKILSPRISLFDPPRNYKQEDKNMFSSSSRKNENDAFVTQTERSVNHKKNEKMNSSSTLATSFSKSIKKMKDSIDFGDVVANKPAFASLKIQNTGKKPLHFSFTQSDEDDAFRICSIPGIIFPGLQTKIKIELLPSHPQEINQSFTFLTPFFEMQIPVKANIIQESS